MTLELTFSGTEVGLTAAEFTQLQEEFRERHHVVLKSLVAGPLLGALSTAIAQARFDAANYDSVGTDLKLSSGVANGALTLAANDPVFLRAIERITSSGSLSSFSGRTYRMLPAAGHMIDWHNDLFGNRRIGMSVNLSTEAYEGGIFEMRLVDQTSLLGRVHNTGRGDAILFRVDPSLEHRVTDVTGTAPKTAFAGWFSGES